MRDNQTLLICRHCGNMARLIDDQGRAIICCGEQMEEMIPNTSEGSPEKHLPKASLSEDILSVQVGSAPHPMEKGHYIELVYVQTEHGAQRKYLNPGEEPRVTFSFSDDRPLAVIACCNLHGLWKTDIK
ncbi:MAG: desulfoferrodoxin [Desulfovibrionaceae bacterium]|nr:desulfoferrodoxin [Desulfovibrionaceae bacterium]